MECGHSLGRRTRQIGLGQKYRHWHLVRLARNQKTVNELRSRLGREERGHEQRLIEIGGNDMRLLREVRRSPYDIVAARFDVGDDGLPRLVTLATHDVANDDGICRPHPFQAQPPAYAARDRTFAQQHLVEASPGAQDHAAKCFFSGHKRHSVIFCFSSSKYGVRLSDIPATGRNQCESSIVFRPTRS